MAPPHPTLASQSPVAAGGQRGQHRDAPYERHRPEQTVLWQTLQRHWRTFEARLDEGDDAPGLPGFVAAEMEAFLRCGILAHGFVRARCRDCGHGRLVAFSCKRRGFCPSCIGRRMCDTAANLVERVLPRVPFRQWVLTLPYALRLKVAYDPALATRVLGIYGAAVSAWLRRRARCVGIAGTLKTGGVTVIQRFNSALDLDPHFHTLMIDGVYQYLPGRPPIFHPTPAPDDEDVAKVAAAVHSKVTRLMRSLGDDIRDEGMAAEEPALLALGAASVQGRLALGENAGRRVLRLQSVPGRLKARVLGRRCAEVGGFNLHADVRIPAGDRAGLERLCRYLARPPIAGERLKELSDGNLLLELKRAWRDGTTHFVYTPEQLIERLVPLVPRPRAHLTRYHGVLAPAFAGRPQIVPAPAAAATERQVPAEAPARTAGPMRWPVRAPWAVLLWRVFKIDVLACNGCGGRLEIIGAVAEPLAIKRILDHLGLRSVAANPHPPRPPPQSELQFDGGQSEPDVDPEYPDDMA